METPLPLFALPYDILLCITHHLGYKDAQVLRGTCKTLREFVESRPVYRHLAAILLHRCRALPLTGFQQPSDLTTPQLIEVTDKAARLERAWLSRTPRPSVSANNPCWYGVVRSPPGEAIDWLSPITSSYTLCATKSGKVICWDVDRDRPLAEWDPRAHWELWKCRVEFATATVYFTMAKIVKGDHHDKVMDFVIMQLQFAPRDPLESPPTFTALASFRTLGVVMNVFLLDPASHLLAAFVFVQNTRSIGLYVVPDWTIPRFVFVDTGVVCTPTGNWSCILHHDELVVHTEDSGFASQHFYPLSSLGPHVQHAPMESLGDWVPTLSGTLAARDTITRLFAFPDRSQLSGAAAVAALEGEIDAALNGPEAPADADPNPFRLPWYPDSCHFVRQWWPSLTTDASPKYSCTVVLLARHDQHTHRNAHVLAQHYFAVPLGAAPLRMWYVSAPFEVVNVIDGFEEPAEGDPDGQEHDRERPLLAVDFGHAVWVEWVQMRDPDEEAEEERTKRELARELRKEVEEVFPKAPRPPGPGDSADGEPPHGEDVEDGPDHEGLDHPSVAPSYWKRLRFVSFPPLALSCEDGTSSSEALPVDGLARTLLVPEELNLDNVETLNIDQSQGTVLLSVKEGKIFVLHYN